MGRTVSQKPGRYESLKGFFTTQELSHLQKSTILLAGCGAGSNLAHLLARYGVGSKTKGAIILADPGFVTERNLVRQAYYEKDIGLKKANALARSCLAINPNLNIKCVPVGITLSNIDSLIQSSDLIFEMIDLSQPGVSFLLHQKAQEAHKPVIVTIDLGDNTLTRVFRNNSQSTTFSNYFGLPPKFLVSNFNQLNPYAVVARLIIGPHHRPALSNSKMAINYYCDQFFTRNNNLQKLLNNVPAEMKPLITAIISGKFNYLPQTGIAGQILGAVHMKLIQNILTNKAVPDANYPIKVYLSDIITKSNNN